MMEIKLTKKQKENLEALGINNVNDLLHYFPYRYETLRYLPYRQWNIDSDVVFQATVCSPVKISYFKGKMSVCYFNVNTDDDQLRVSIFNRPWLNKLKVGEMITVIGKYEGNCKVLAYQISNQPLQEILGIHPVYSLKDRITPKTFQKLVNNALAANQNEIEDFIPQQYLDRYGYLSAYDSLNAVHNPDDEEKLANAIRTLKYEEFLKFNLTMLSRRKVNFDRNANFRKEFDLKKVNEFIKHLPFELTSDQKNAVREILNDMHDDHQMFRLLQGDVGSGKTIVGFIAMYGAYLSGCQAALMAPTEILARQHYNNMIRVFENMNISCGILYSSQSLAERNEVLEGLKNGSIDFVVGTHSLFQDSVEYDNLGLIITDEQHRFGVKQRTALLTKGYWTDILMMSATPIPRTMASTLYGDIDVSTIEQTPNSAKTIHTKLIEKNSFIPVLDEINELLQQGNQMYVVCPSIESASTGRNVTEIYKNLSSFFKGKYKVGLLHGQLSAEEKNDTEQDFKDGKIDILVSTTVIEVGVDVANANIMVIYDANRFGLSQLHQLRGRIGRGQKPGYCYLLTSADDQEAIEKLKIIVENTDGFKISYYDLKLRGPGDVMGYRQSGLPAFRIGNLINDADILQQSKKDATEIIERLDQYPIIEKYINDNFDNSILLS